MFTRYLYLMTLAAGFMFNQLAQAQTEQYEKHANIALAAQEFARELASVHGQEAKISIKVDPLDKRLTLSKCTAPLSAFESPNSKNSGRTTVGVRCDGDKNWKLYVPVTIEVIRNVVTIRQGVTRRAALKESDLVMQEKDISGMHNGYYTDSKAVIGKLVKTSLKAGTVISPRNLKTPLAIKKGTTVTIIAELSGIKIRMKGKALKSGGIGEGIAVENSSSSRKIEGKILDDGIVGVML